MRYLCHSYPCGLLTDDSLTEAANPEWKSALHRDKKVFGANEARVTKHLTEVSSLGSFGSQSFGVTFIEPAQFEADVAELERDP